MHGAARMNLVRVKATHDCIPICMKMRERQRYSLLRQSYCHRRAPSRSIDSEGHSFFRNCMRLIAARRSTCRTLVGFFAASDGQASTFSFAVLIRCAERVLGFKRAAQAFLRARMRAWLRIASQRSRPLRYSALLPRRERPELIRSFMMLLGRKTSTRRGVMGTSLPVLGLRPMRSPF